MKKIVFVFFVALASVSIHSKACFAGYNQVVKSFYDIKSMFENEQYQDIVDQYASTPRTLSAEELTYVSLSYAHLEDLISAIKYADLAIQKGAKYAEAYYAKAVAYNMEGSYGLAVENIKKAISLNPKQADYHTELGDIYFVQQDYKNALTSYRRAITQPIFSEKAYYMIGATYANLDDIKNALDTFYIAKSRVVKDKELYVTILYNIGKIEFDNKAYRKALIAYQELTDHFPDDYYSLEKEIQCYYALEDYSRADEIKSRLYTAYSKGELASTSLADMFCLNHFTAAGKDVMAYERYEEPSGHSFVKYIFYIADTEGNIEYTIYLNFVSPQKDGNQGVYKLVMEKDDNHYTFNTVFDENVKYSTLQPYIKEIVNGEINPVIQED